MRTRYTRLYTAWENETKRLTLQNIPDDFIHEMKSYTTQLNKTTTSPETLSGNLTQTERNYANHMFKQLVETRLDKIIKSELNGLPINAQAMTPEEQQLHSNMRQLLTEYRQGIELLQVKTLPIKQMSPVKESMLVHEIEEKHTELVLVRFLQPLPAIMGIDMKAYGPFQPEELATIPRQNADNLIKRGVVKRVETDD